MNRSQLNDLEFDAFQEVGNVGSGNAATALSVVLNKNIAINIPETKFVPLTQFSQELGGPDMIVRSVYMDISGDLKGDVFFFFKKEDVLNLADFMLGNSEGTSKDFDDMVESAFGEMANIFSGAYLSSLSDMLEYKVLPGVPHHNYDMLQAILDAVLSRKSLDTDEILSIKSVINTDDSEVTGNFVLMFDNESLQKIIQRLDEKFGINLE